MKKQREKTKGKEEPPREYDILGAVRAVNKGKSPHEAIKVHRLTQAQADDLYEHLAAQARLKRHGWPALTPFERRSVYGDDFGGPRRRPLRIVIPRHDEAATVCSA